MTEPLGQSERWFRIMFLRAMAMTFAIGAILGGLVVYLVMEAVR